jgi:hypothetical protein
MGCVKRLRLLRRTRRDCGPDGGRYLVVDSVLLGEIVWILRPNLRMMSRY